MKDRMAIQNWVEDAKSGIASSPGGYNHRGDKLGKPEWVWLLAAITRRLQVVIFTMGGLSISKEKNRYPKRSRTE